MKYLLNYLVTQLVTKPEEIAITEQIENSPIQPDSGTDNEGKHLKLTLHVADDDMGLIIGKNGQVISAIRSLLKLKNTSNKLYDFVTFQLEEKTPASTE